MHADATRLEQVLVNLLTNAAKYTGRGGAISVRLAREDIDGKAQAIVRVRDSGRGIPKEMLEQVFDMFVQVSPTIDRGTGGLGLGLTLVRQLTQMHGGTVSAHSDGPGTGSELVVRLPLIEMQHAELIGVSAPPPFAVPAKRRILVVEDAADVRDTLRDFLELLGHEVAVAKDGLEGVALILSMRPDVALVDVGLPGIDGYEVARRVRTAAGGDKLFLVALSGYGGPDAKAKAEREGFDLHMTKPVDIDELPRVVNCSRSDINC